MGGTRLRHCIAWLEINNKVRCHCRDTKTLYWAHTGWSTTETFEDILHDHHSEDDRDSSKTRCWQIEPINEQQDSPDDGYQENDSEDDLEDGDHSDDSR